MAADVRLQSALWLCKMYLNIRHSVVIDPPIMQIIFTLQVKKKKNVTLQSLGIIVKEVRILSFSLQALQWTSTEGYKGGYLHQGWGDYDSIISSIIGSYVSESGIMLAF